MGEAIVATARELFVLAVLVLFFIWVGYQITRA